MSEALIQQARDALTKAYVPYSEYRVGAALRATDGTVFVGCNIENANYSNSLHAEEVALAEAIKSGYTEFDRLAVTSAARDGVTPCGMCRQTLAEFCDEDLVVVCDEETKGDEDGEGGDSDENEETSEYTLGELLPNTISFGTLEAAKEQRG